MGNDSPGYFSKPMTVITDKLEPVVQLDEKSLKPKARDEQDNYMATVTDTAIIDGINAIKAKDPQFTASHFLMGAKGAFEMVFDAFAKGDVQTLKLLMSDALFEQFGKAIAERDAKETRTETTLVSVQAKDIIRAELNNMVARLTVHFTSEQVSVERNKAGEMVGGDASDIRHAEDHWVFERDITSKNPNWKIIET